MYSPNNAGETGQPCLTPLVTTASCKGPPGAQTGPVADLYSAITPLIVTVGNEAPSNGPRAAISELNACVRERQRQRETDLCIIFECSLIKKGVLFSSYFTKSGQKRGRWGMEEHCVL